jgi:hypothetical protein
MLAVRPFDEVAATSSLGDSTHPQANRTNTKTATVGHRLSLRIQGPLPLRLGDLTPFRTLAIGAHAPLRHAAGERARALATPIEQLIEQVKAAVTAGVLRLDAAQARRNRPRAARGRSYRFRNPQCLRERDQPRRREMRSRHDRGLCLSAMFALQVPALSVVAPAALVKRIRAFLERYPAEQFPQLCFPARLSSCRTSTRIAR